MILFLETKNLICLNMEKVKEILSIIMLVMVIITILCALIFMLDREHSKTKTTIFDESITASSYTTKRGNKVDLVIYRPSGVTFREYEEGIQIYIKFKSNKP
jgi:hypothetical protein